MDRAPPRGHPIHQLAAVRKSQPCAVRRADQLRSRARGHRAVGVPDVVPVELEQVVGVRQGRFLVPYLGGGGGSDEGHAIAAQCFRTRERAAAHAGGVASAGAAASYVIWRITRAGTPAATENAGMSVVTTELAPITHRSPIVTPLVMTTPAPHQTLSPIRVGPLLVNPCHGTGSLGSSNRWLESVT